MKKIFIPFLLIVALVISFKASAQTVLYTQNFDGSSSLPTGWYATPNSWFNDTTLGNASSGYIGASGKNNIVIQDTLAHVGYDSLISSAITTTGYDNITVEWGARLSKHYADSGSTIGLYWSTNGTTWTQATYTENPNNSNWYPENDSTPVALPAGAANQATLWLMWLADIHFGPSGTYRIDDVVVEGTSTAGITNIASESFANIYVSGNSSINISIGQPLTESVNVSIYDLTGKLISETAMNTQSITIDGRNFSEGMYLVRVSDSDRSMVTKVLIK